MSLISKLFGMETKASVIQKIKFMASGMAAPNNWNYAQIANEADRQNAISSRCMQLIREAACTVPLMVFVGDKEIEGHEFLNLLKRPNPFMCGTQLLEQFYGYYVLVGDTYLERVMIGQKLKELYVHRPDNIKVKLDGSGFPAAYEINKNGRIVGEFNVEKGNASSDMMHMWSFDPTSEWTGKASVYSAAYAIDAHNKGSRWRKGLLDNSAMPSGVITYGNKDGGGNLTDDQFTNLEKQINDKFVGGNNAGKPAILEGGLSWQSTGFSPREMDTSTLKDADAREIALALGVPPVLLGLKGDSTYSNLKEAGAAFYRTTVLNVVNKGCDNLTAWLMPVYGDDFRVVPDLEKIEALAVERQAVWDKIQKADFLTINEKRELIGYDKVDDGDQIMIAANMLPLGDDQAVEGGGEPEDEE